MRHAIYVVGVGPGGPDYLTPAARRVVEGCDLLIGGRRALELFEHLPVEKLRITGDLGEILEVLKGNQGRRKMAVLVSGDPGLYSLLDYLLRHFPAEALQVIPGVSSMQLAFARARMSWHDARLISLHGRSREELLPAVKGCSKVGVFTDSGFQPREMARYLLEHGVKGKKMIVCQNLSYPDEKLAEGSLEEMAMAEDDYDNCVVVIADA